MSEIKQASEKSYKWIYDTDLFSNMSADYFSPEYWEKEGAITGQETGRGTTFFIKHKNNRLVLRHYLRGGLVSKMNRDQYLFTSFEKCRSISEFNILTQLQQLGLPSPIPAAAQVHKSGSFYKADILIHQIPNAQDLVSVLQAPQNASFYADIGKLVAKFHKAGLYHADLNIKNILHDDKGGFWLIDFDRARFKKPSLKWRRSNLSRLKRSFEKELVRSKIKWSINDWNSLHKAYEQSYKTH